MVQFLEVCPFSKRVEIILQLISLWNSVQLHIGVWLFVTPWTVARQASLSITNSQSLLKLMSIDAIQPSHPVLSFSSHLHSFLAPGSFPTSNPTISSCSLLLLPSIFPSIKVFSNESLLEIRWPKYWSFSFSPCNEYSGLISFRMDCLDLLAVQGTFKSLLQHYSSKASILWHWAFFIVPTLPSIHDYWKNHSFVDGPLLAK